MQVLNLLPAELGINDANMKAVADTEYAGKIVDLSKAYRVMVRSKVTETGTGAGAAQIIWQETDKSGADYGAQLPLITGVSTQVNLQIAVFHWGGDLAAGVVNGTIGSNVDKFLHVFRTGYLILEVTTQNNGTTSTCDVELVAQLYD